MVQREERSRESDKILYLAKENYKKKTYFFLFSFTLSLGLYSITIGAAKVQREAGRMKHEQHSRR